MDDIPFELVRVEEFWYGVISNSIGEPYTRNFDLRIFTPGLVP